VSDKSLLFSYKEMKLLIVTEMTSYDRNNSI